MSSGGGTILLKMAIQFLKDNKKKYGIHRIVLQDNSMLRCPINRTEIKLNLLHTLKFGHTWYGGRYGFRPYDHNTKSTNKLLMEKYEKNYRIVKHTKVIDTKLIRYMDVEFIKLFGEKKAKEIKESVEKDCIKNNLSIRDFFGKYFLNFTKTCNALSAFIEKYCDRVGITDFSGKAFFINI